MDEVKIYPRQREAVGLANQGKTNSEIATAMGISSVSVRTYLTQARMAGVVVKNRPHPGATKKKGGDDGR